MADALHTETLASGQTVVREGKIVGWNGDQPVFESASGTAAVPGHSLVQATPGALAAVAATRLPPQLQAEMPSLAPAPVDAPTNNAAAFEEALLELAREQDAEAPTVVVQSREGKLGVTLCLHAQGAPDGVAVVQMSSDTSPVRAAGVGPGWALTHVNGARITFRTVVGYLRELASWGHEFVAEFRGPQWLSPAQAARHMDAYHEALQPGAAVAARAKELVRRATGALAEVEAGAAKRARLPVGGGA